MDAVAERSAVRTVLVIGGGGDIGQAIVEAFRARGDDVVSTDRAMLDLASSASIDSFLRDKKAIPHDIVFAAATNEPKSFLDTEIGTVLEAINVNFASFLRLAHGLAPRMADAGGGAITVISSLYGAIGRAGRLPYASSKHALVGAVQTLAIELGPRRIRVNSVTPGFVDTKLTRRNISPEKLDALTANIPLGRLGLPRDIADAVLFMHGDAARYITGQNIIVDGGFMAGGFLGV